MQTGTRLQVDSEMLDHARYAPKLARRITSRLVSAS
jgi:hypothetical protein